MEHRVELSLNGDAQQARALGQWISRGVHGCTAALAQGPAQDGAKGIELSTTLIVTLLGTPAVVQLVEVLKAYVSARPSISIDVTRADGSRVGIVANNVALAQVSELASEMVKTTGTVS